MAHQQQDLLGVRPPPQPHPPSGITGPVAITDMTSEHMNFPLGKSITIRNLCPSIEYNNILLLGIAGELTEWHELRFRDRY